MVDEFKYFEALKDHRINEILCEECLAKIDHHTHRLREIVFDLYMKTHILREDGEKWSKMMDEMDVLAFDIFDSTEMMGKQLDEMHENLYAIRRMTEEGIHL